MNRWPTLWMLLVVSCCLLIGRSSELKRTGRMWHYRALVSLLIGVLLLMLILALDEWL
jgi:hypothetical protein